MTVKAGLKGFRGKAESLPNINWMLQLQASHWDIIPAFRDAIILLGRPGRPQGLATVSWTQQHHGRQVVWQWGGVLVWRDGQDAASPLEKTAKLKTSYTKFGQLMGEGSVPVGASLD